MDASQTVVSTALRPHERQHNRDSGRPADLLPAAPSPGAAPPFAELATSAAAAAEVNSATTRNNSHDSRNEPGDRGQEALLWASYAPHYPHIYAALTQSSTPTPLATTSEGALATISTVYARKYPAPPDNAEGRDRAAKRPRYAGPYPNFHSLMRTHVQQCIALVLKHIGFDSATPEALEEFTLLVENYIHEFALAVNRSAAAARRSAPTPVDFELVLPVFNLRPRHLKPHLKPPRRLPRTRPCKRLFARHFPQTSQPDLHVFPMLSAAQQRASKPHIPPHFPSFPSLHTFTFTPTEVRRASAIVSGSEINEAEEAAQLRKRKQEQINTESKEAQEALRRLFQKLSRKDAGARSSGKTVVNGRQKLLCMQSAFEGLP